MKIVKVSKFSKKAQRYDEEKLKNLIIILGKFVKVLEQVINQVQVGSDLTSDQLLQSINKLVPFIEDGRGGIYDYHGTLLGQNGSEVFEPMRIAPFNSLVSSMRNIETNLNQVVGSPDERYKIAKMASDFHAMAVQAHEEAQRWYKRSASTLGWV